DPLDVLAAHDGKEPRHRPSPVGRVTCSTKMSCRLGSTISNRLTRRRAAAARRTAWGSAPSASLISAERPAAGTRATPGRAAREAGEEASAPLVGEGYRVLAVAALHLAHGSVQDLLAAVDEGHAVAQPLHRVHLVARQDEGLARPAHLEEDVPHEVRAHRIEAAHRLVEDEDVRVVEHGGHELRLLLHAPPEAVHLPLAPPPAPPPPPPAPRPPA